MYNLALHIEYLLLRHDCVTVPGFGAFINVRNDSKFDENEQLISPSASEITFNSSLTFDDGLLASSFARKYCVAFERGREILLKEISTLKNALQSDREVTIGKLGILSVDEKNLISFKPRCSANRLMEEIGYFSVPLKKVTVSADNIRDIEEVKSEDGMTPIESKSIEGKDDKYYHFRIHKRLLKVVASLLVIIVATLSIMIPEGNFINQKVDKASVLPLIDTTRKKSQPTHELTADPKNDSTESAEEVIQNSTDDLYFLIVATFRTKDEADLYITLHKNDGFDYEAVQSRKLCRVSVASSTSKEDLQSLKKTENFRNKYPDAWVWHE